MNRGEWYKFGIKCIECGLLVMVVNKGGVIDNWKLIKYDNLGLSYLDSEVL